MPDNRLVMEICLSTGLRLSDVLNLRSADLKKRMTIRELKTGKNRKIFLSDELLKRCVANAGKVFVFENRNDWKKHRTRQAVYKDLKRTAKLFRVKLNVAPHTARKVYAVEQFQKDGDLKRVQALLNHEETSVTMLYAMADEITKRKLKA